MRPFWLFFLFLLIFECANGPLAVHAATRHYHFLVKEVPASPDGYPRFVIGVFDLSLPLSAAPPLTVHSPFPLSSVDLSSHIGMSSSSLESSFPYMRSPYPGPTIYGCMHDTVTLEVTNALTQGLSIHMHGVHNDNENDGVDMLTECPIQPKQTKNYTTQITQHGTFWYHAHSFTQHVEGVYGVMVIYDTNCTSPSPSTSPSSSPSLSSPSTSNSVSLSVLSHLLLDSVNRVHAVDGEWIITVNEWYHERADILALNYMSPTLAFKGYRPQYPWPPSSILLSGIGQFNCSAQWETVQECDRLRAQGLQCQPSLPPFISACSSPSPSPSLYRCHHGSRVRVRVVNVGAAMPMRVWFQAHPLTIIMKDGVPVRRQERRSALTIDTGERYDVVIECNQRIDRKYHIYASVSPHFIPPGGQNWVNLSSYAYIVYDDYLNVSSIDDIPVFSPPQSPLPSSSSSSNKSSSVVVGDEDAVEIQSDDTPISDDTVAGIDVERSHWHDDMLLAYHLSPSFSFTIPAASSRIFLSNRVTWFDFVGESSAASAAAAASAASYVIGEPLERWALNGHFFKMPPDKAKKSTRFNERKGGGGKGDVGETEALASGVPLSHARWFEHNYDDVDHPLYIPVRLGDVVEVVLFNNDLQQHPWHLHGFSAWVLGSWFLSSSVDFEHRYKVDESIRHSFFYNDTNAVLPLNQSYYYNSSAPSSSSSSSSSLNISMSDSFVVPGYGYTVFRFKAEKTGPWILHCHMRWHAMMGMAAVFDVRNELGGYEPPKFPVSICGSLSSMNASRLNRLLGNEKNVNNGDNDNANNKNSNATMTGLVVLISVFVTLFVVSFFKDLLL